MLKTCLYCGEPIQATRSTKLYCDSQCKQRYHALNDKIIRDGDGAEEMLKHLAMQAKNYPGKLPEVLKQVNRIESIASRLGRILQS
jgi:hypothetical protein